MEEKERYKVYKDNRGNAYICDTIKNIDYKIYQEFVDSLNQQDKELSKLRASYQQVKEENQQLKQELHDLPKKIVEEIRDVAGEYWDFNICKECGNVPLLNTLTTKDFDEILDEILKKFGGEDESK